MIEHLRATAEALEAMSPNDHLSASELGEVGGLLVRLAAQLGVITEVVRRDADALHRLDLGDAGGDDPYMRLTTAIFCLDQLSNMFEDAALDAREYHCAIQGLSLA